MPRKITSLNQMNANGLAYLANHTDITFLSEGSVARSLLEATNLEISKLQDYILSSYRNVFPSTADSYYLDIIGEGIGLPRFGSSYASSSAEDKNVKFSITSGKLGSYFPDPSNANNGVVPKGTVVSTTDETIKYDVSADTVFPFNAKEVFVPVLATTSGESNRVGKHKLVSHSGPAAVNVTNLKSISNGSSGESDRSYRFRILNHLTASPTGNQLAIKLAAIGNPDISRVELREFARGAGTFDALLIPVGNTVTNSTKTRVQSAIDQASAFGVNGRAVEPRYRTFKITIQLIEAKGTGAGLVDSAKITAKNAALDYMETIQIGGELVINRLRSAVVERVDVNIKDIKILELCIDGRPHVIRNIKLRPDELFTPHVDRTEEAIQII